MSDKTKADLEAALAAHVSDEEENPVLVTGYVFGVALTKFDNSDTNRHTYWFDSQDHQAPHVTRGLADILGEWACGTALVDDDD